MQNNRFILAGLLAIVLTACGGGGSDDNSVKVNQAIGSNGNTNTNTKIDGQQSFLEKPIATLSPLESDKLTKLNIKYSEKGQLKTFTFDEEDLSGFSGFFDNKNEKLTVNGKKIPNFVLNNTLSYARFGMIAGLGDPAQNILFHQGEVTPVNAIPVAASSATYKGDAFVVDMTDKNKRTIGAKSEFNVDFARKSVKGTISNIEIDGRK
ncbi:MAG: hypothetical protein J6W29_04220, partial [Neisseriaceae bacterium]|nr:hypothetical protein [Neisseriaceae bacterium]